jgi:hypothetical protein
MTSTYPSSIGPKTDAREALDRLRRLDVAVKVITGDNDRVAQKVCADIGLAVEGTLTGAELDRLDDAQLAAALPQTTIFARVTPTRRPQPPWRSCDAPSSTSTATASRSRA